MKSGALYIWNVVIESLTIVSQAESFASLFKE
jgi:hypothetical protein